MVHSLNFIRLQSTELVCRSFSKSDNFFLSRIGMPGGHPGSTCEDNASIGTALQSLDPLSTLMIVFCLLAYYLDTLRYYNCMVNSQSSMGSVNWCAGRKVYNQIGLQTGTNYTSGKAPTNISKIFSTIWQDFK